METSKQNIADKLNATPQYDLDYVRGYNLDKSMVEQRHGLEGDWLSADDLAKTFGLWRGYVPNHGVVFRAEPPT